MMADSESTYMDMGSLKRNVAEPVRRESATRDEIPPLNTTTDIINVFHEEDGGDIANHIHSKLSQEKFQFKVNLLNISEEHNFTHATVNVILLTPQMLEILTSGVESNSKITQYASKTIVLNHSVDLDADSNADTLASKFNPYSSCDTVQIEQSDYGFRKAMVDIVQIVERCQVENKPLPSLKVFNICPQTVWSCSDKVLIYFMGKTMPGGVTVEVVDDKKSILKTYCAKRLTKTVFVFHPEGLSNGQKKLHVRVEGRLVGKCELFIKSKVEILSNILSDINSPIEFMCQALKLDEKTEENLDMELSDMFTNGQQSDVSLMSLQTSEIERAKKLEYPTLLHVGAKYGLARFCSKLLQCSWSQAALTTKNKDQRLPHHLAVLAGHTDLAAELLATMRLNRSSQESNQSNGSIDDADPRSSGEFEEVLLRRPTRGYKRISSDVSAWTQRMTMVWSDGDDDGTDSTNL